MSYTELQVTTNFSFLRGASHPEELMQQAFSYNYETIGVTDRNSLAGIVRMHSLAKQNQMRLIVGCRLDLLDGPSLLAYPTDLAAYSRLSKLLTLGMRRAPKGQCHLHRADVFTAAKGMKFILVSPEQINDLFEASVKEYCQELGRELNVALTPYYQGNDAKRFAWLAQMAKKHMTPLVGTNDVHYHHAKRRELQDVLTCIREKCTIRDAGYRLFANAERHLKTQNEMKRLFEQYPDAVKRTQSISEACRFSLDELKYEYPYEITSEGRTPQQELVHQTWTGVRERHGDHVPEDTRQTLDKELKLIEELDYAPYFLTVYDIVRYARSQNILCQGRGSAANSAVCYYLGITSVDPVHHKLLFERFISSARNEPPDIDVDFEHERREEVMQYVFRKYGRHRAGVIATVSQYRQRGAIRDVGKVMGLSGDMIEKIGGTVWRFDEFFTPQGLADAGLDIENPLLRKTMLLAEEILDFPRHLSQHVGGFVIARHDLSELCPIMNATMADRTCIEWNKDDIDDLRFMKVDVLALGMLTCIRKSFDLIQQCYNKQWTLATIPQDQPETYAMISAADTIGVFQVESRAQMSMLPRLRPKCFYDLVIQVAIVRPGPIQGDMVHPYLKRRNGEEEVVYPKEELKPILQRTLGVPLFQEQAMKIAIVAAGFTPHEADRLRKSMATFRNDGTINQWEEKLINGMLKNGYEEDFARRCYRQFQGFASYGFPESHAASFACLVYASAWIKCNYPDAFACGLLNSQPLGFYLPAQIVIDAKKAGVTVREIDINHSNWDNTLEEKTGRYHAMRLGLRQIKGLGRSDANKLLQARGPGYADLGELWQRAGLTLPVLETLARADAFRSLGLDRRQALWQIKALGDAPLAIFKQQPAEGLQERAIQLPAMPQSEHVVHDYAVTSLSLKAHPVSFLRPRLDKMEASRLADLAHLPDGKYVRVAGLVLMRQSPGTAKGIIFVTMEDETGMGNAVLFNTVSETYRKAVISAKLMMVSGTIQKESGVIYVIARTVEDLSPWLEKLTQPSQPELPMLIPEIKHGHRGSNRTNRQFPGSRDFK